MSKIAWSQLTTLAKLDGLSCQPMSKIAWSQLTTLAKLDGPSCQPMSKMAWSQLSMVLVVLHSPIISASGGKYL